MKRTAGPYAPPLLLALGVLLAGAAGAQQPADDEPVPRELEVTMTLMPEGAREPEAVTRVIELPAAASARAAEASEHGLSRADAAREARQEGLDRAAEAREKGRELGEEIAEQARENREDAGRGRPPEPPPGGPPQDPPGPPDGS